MNTSERLSFGELLQQLRKGRRMSQKQLAERIGASRETISLWERDSYKPETDTMLYEITRVLGLTEQEQQQLFEAYTVTALVTSFHNPPLKRNPYFTGRRHQLNQLHTLLMAGKQVALTQAISGLGGIGKTQLALEYAYHYQKSYHDIFWVNADTEESFMASYVHLAGLLLNNLASLNKDQGEYAEAELLYQRALHIREQQLGPEHLQVAYPLNNLASLYREQGKYAEAEPLYQRALHIWELQLGPEHPQVAYSLNGLASLYREQGRYGEAEPLFRRALRIREQQLGPEHPDTGATLHDLAAFQEIQGNQQEALALYQRALTIREQALGSEHPKTRTTRQRLIALKQPARQEALPPQEDTPLERGEQNT